ncbi:sugar transferase [Microbacterium sp. bgisy189]|uniref:sugar transferase n=1 Tax=Microbacterium sp. bgisy189 TaxID=3413798 RepID=UPI003EC09867
MTALDDASGALTTGVLAPPFASAATASAPRISRALERRHRWERRFRWTLRTTDAAVVIATCLLAVFVAVQSAGFATWTAAGIAVVTALATAACWLAMLSFFLTRATGVIGSGATEYWRVAQATGMSFGLLAIAFIAFEWDGIRTQLLFALPVGLVALLAGRWLARRWLVGQRARGACTSRALVVGSRSDIEYVIRILSGSHLGYQVIGAFIEGEEVDALRVDAAIYPVLRSHTIAESANVLDADTIIVANRPADDPDYIKRLTWELERTAAELVVSSRITDVAGPRMSLRPVEGLPLLHVQIPTFEGGAHVAKRALDVVAAVCALVLFAPFAAIIAIAIKLDSPGPVFFPQARVGRDGRHFRMLKFRSMTVDAEQQREALMSANEGAGPLFKIQNDPRVTRIGRILRKYSLDEVPQFWNVLRGDMSVVGPRPPLPQEALTYDGTVFRRLYIKPGITGPWQVGGRSDLSWEESVRLDLRYVENWSVLSDLVLMWRTAKIMIRPQGAY